MTGAARHVVLVADLLFPKENLAEHRLVGGKRVLGGERHLGVSGRLLEPGGVDRGIAHRRARVGVRSRGFYFVAIDEKSLAARIAYRAVDIGAGRVGIGAAAIGLHAGVG